MDCYSCFAAIVAMGY